MAHYEDLEPCDYVRLNLARRHLALAVGWLELGFDYSKGDDPPARFLDRLAEITAAPRRGEKFYAGFHECELSGEGRQGCYAPGDPRFPITSSRELFVPFEGCLFVSPENVGHYIVAHRYSPPRVFIEAVENCPLPGSEEYEEQTWRFFRLTAQDLGPVPDAVPWLKK